MCTVHYLLLEKGIGVYALKKLIVVAFWVRTVLIFEDEGC